MSAIPDEHIKQVALACGFTERQQPNGEQDLNPYVYQFARELIAEAMAVALSTEIREINKSYSSDETYLQHLHQFGALLQDQRDEYLKRWEALKSVRMAQQQAGDQA